MTMTIQNLYDDIGNCRLLKGDCLERMAEIPDSYIDMVLCDLPYGTTQNKWDSVIPLDLLWKQYNRIAKINAAFVFTAAQPFTTALAASNLSNLKYALIWDKVRPVGHLNAKNRPMNRHEDILVFCRETAPYFPQDLIYKPRTVKRTTTDNYNAHGTSNFSEYTNYPVSILRYPPSTPRIHPTQKPTELMMYLIKTYCPTGGTVLDNCMGSGTTGVACVNTGYRFVGIERDDAYYDVCKERITKALTA